MYQQLYHQACVISSCQYLFLVVRKLILKPVRCVRHCSFSLLVARSALALALLPCGALNLTQHRFPCLLPHQQPAGHSSLRPLAAPAFCPAMPLWCSLSSRSYAGPREARGLPLRVFVESGEAGSMAVILQQQQPWLVLGCSSCLPHLAAIICPFIAPCSSDFSENECRCLTTSCSL